VVGTEDLQVKKVTGQITALSQPGRSSKPVGTGELIECRQTPSRDLDHLQQRIADLAKRVGATFRRLLARHELNIRIGADFSMPGWARGNRPSDPSD
jgi:hypothetical protein